MEPGLELMLMVLMFPVGIFVICFLFVGLLVVVEWYKSK